MFSLFSVLDVGALSELHRLSYVVKNIDNETAVVPKGAYAVDEHNTLAPSVVFKGLTKDVLIFNSITLLTSTFNIFE